MSDLHSGPRDDVPDPQAVYASEGEEGLRQRLADLDRGALEEVIRAHPPHHTPPPALETMSDSQLVGYIVDGVERKASE